MAYIACKLASCVKCKDQYIIYTVEYQYNAMNGIPERRTHYKGYALYWNTYVANTMCCTHLGQ